MPNLSTAKTNLQRLALVRLLVVMGLVVAILSAYGWLQSPLQFAWLLGITLTLGTATVFTFWRVNQPWLVTDAEYFAQLLFDVVALGALLYFSGGATNPFISYLLVPLSIAAAILPGAYTLALALIGIAIYSALLFYYQPLAVFRLDAAAITPDMQMHIAMGHLPDPRATPSAPPKLNAHIFGMWFNFALSSALITYVVTRMAATVREQQAELNHHREEALHNEQVLAVATLAAGTAHELGTPLSTMTLLLDDMHSGDAELNSDIALLKQQVQTCRATLKNLVNTAEANQQQRTVAPLDDILRVLLERWQVLRPQATYQLHVDSHTAAPRFACDETLQQAIINLLNNAADTDSGAVELRTSWDADTITLRIRDRGPGIALAVASRLGKPFVTTKGKGLGLGLFLSHATIERAGGDIRLFNHTDGGTEAVLRLPVVKASQ